MKLEDLLEGVEIDGLLGKPDFFYEIGNISFDSRKTGKNDVFIAIRGFSNDGHDYIASLAEKGVKHFIVEYFPKNLPQNLDICMIKVSDTHKSLGIMASNFYGNPSRQLKLIGVTGTNGKTTTATLIYEMARKEGVRAGLLSTIANYIDGERIDSTHTTPDPVQLNRLLRIMADAGCRIVAMEVSSHAAHQHRIAGLEFAGAVFSNLTRDHLDYHNTFSAYRDAKKMFFDNLSSDAFALVNSDDKNGLFMLQNCKARKFTYGRHGMPDFKFNILEKYIDGTLMQINGQEILVRFTGEFNAYNLTAVYASMVLSGFDKEQTLIDLTSMKPVAGRFQTFHSKGGITAIVDYAHTPDALENVIASINDVKKETDRLITVVGAGGNRDKGKRPLMAQICTRNSWLTILTSDNPRDEEPMDIINEMMSGVDDDKMQQCICNPDRKSAIATAYKMAQKGDIILVAGKGHENYQEIKGVKHHFDDAEEIRKLMSL